MTVNFDKICFLLLTTFHNKNLAARKNFYVFQFSRLHGFGIFDHLEKKNYRLQNQGG